MSRARFHKKKKQHLFRERPVEGAEKAHSALVKFYETSAITNTNMDDFNQEVNVGKRPVSREDKEKDIFQKGAEALRNLFGGMKKKGDSVARANNATTMDEDEYITGEEGLALEETEKKRRLAKLQRKTVRYNALGQELSASEKAELLLAEAEFGTGGGDEVKDGTPREDLRDSGGGGGGGGAAGEAAKPEKPPLFNIANMFRKVTQDIKEVGRSRAQDDQKSMLAALKLRKQKDGLDRQKLQAQKEAADARRRLLKAEVDAGGQGAAAAAAALAADEAAATSGGGGGGGGGGSGGAAAVTPRKRASPKAAAKKSPKSSSPKPSPKPSPRGGGAGKGGRPVDVFAKVREELERKGAEKQVAMDARQRADEEEGRRLDEHMREAEKEITDAVDRGDFAQATALQAGLDELKEERELLKLKPTERGLKKAASRARSNSGNKVQDFFADLGQKTAKLAADAKSKFEEVGNALTKPSNDDVGLVSLPGISRQSTTPRSRSLWDTQASMLRIAWEAVEEGDLGKLRQLHQRGVRINDARVKSTTPLHLAAARGFPDVCRLLVLTKADVEAQDAMGQTPMHMAVNFKQEECIQFLQTKGASLFTLNIFGRCPYDYDEKLCQQFAYPDADVGAK